MRQIPVLLDVDTGIDDAYALIMACASEELDIRAVTTAAGNASLYHTTRNTCNLLHLLGRGDIPVSQGLPGPLQRPLLRAPEVHGENGLRGYQFQGEHLEALSPLTAQQQMARVLTESEEPVTIVALGPATNVAAFLQQYPELKSRIRRILFMGASYRCGNPTIVSTFNVLVDPEAFDILLKSGVELHTLPLDTTRHATLTPEECRQIAGISGPVAKMVSRTLAGYGDRIGQKGGCLAQKDGERDWNQEGLAHLPDPAVVAYLLRPNYFTRQKYFCQVECKGELTTGFTVIDMEDYYGKSMEERNLWYVDSIDRAGFARLFLESVRHFTPDLING